jgi:hypothetical protein
LFLKGRREIRRGDKQERSLLKLTTSTAGENKLEKNYLNVRPGEMYPCVTDRCPNLSLDQADKFQIYSQNTFHTSSVS